VAYESDTKASGTVGSPADESRISDEEDVKKFVILYCCCTQPRLETALEASAVTQNALIKWRGRGVLKLYGQG
jgi:hypothetical protein